MKSTTLLQKLHILPPPQKVDSERDHALPAEILEKIFGYYIAERDACPTPIYFTRTWFQPTLRAAARVCRAWYEVATKHLYRQIYLSSTKAAERLADALGMHKHLRPFVHQFFLISKIYKTGIAQSLYTMLDIYSIRRIHSLCPNLMMLVKANPWMKALPEDDDLVFRAIDLDRAQIDRLTYLELAIPNEAFFGGRMAFSSSLEFPALHTLHLSCSFASCDEEGGLRSSSPQWFKMPQLRRLGLKDFEVKSWQTLTFPDSPFINTIELLGGDYTMVNDFFDPSKSPLLPFRKTLHTLTITAKQVGEIRDDILLSRRLDLYQKARYIPPVWSMEFLENVEELCLPFCSFADTMITFYPRRLSKLALVGYHPDLYQKPLKVIVDGHTRLANLFKNLKNYRGPIGLREVRVLLQNLDMFPFDFMQGLGDAADIGIRVKLGVTVYNFRDLTSDLGRITLKTLRMK